MKISKQIDNQAIKFQHNAIYMDVRAVAEIYINTIAEDILPFQYGKIASALDYVIKSLNDHNITFPTDMDEDIKEQIIEIKKISYKLKENSELVKQALIEYLQENYDLYTMKDKQISKIIAEKNPQNRLNIVDNFINDKVDDKRQELISIAISNYDTTNKLIGYREDQASQTQKQAWLNRDCYIQSRVDQRLKEWIVLEKDNYLKAVGIYTNPKQASVVIRQYQEQSSRMLQETQKALSSDQYNLRMGKNIKSIEGYLLVEEGVITEREAELFNYQELNTYQAYYGENERIIKDIFQYAREYYPKSKTQGLKELAEVNHEKIANIFNLLTAVKNKKISFKDIAEYSREKVEILDNNNHLLKILNPKDIFDIQAAITNNKPQIINKIILDISAKNKGEILKWAANKGYDLLANSILEKGNNISAKHIGIALQKASYNGYADIAEILLKKGKNISAKHIGIALQKASYNGYADIAEILLEKGDNISEENMGVALELATKKGYYETVEILLKKGDNTPLEYKVRAFKKAIKKGYYEVVKAILENVDEIPTKYKDRALELAVLNGDCEIVRVILENAGSEISIEHKYKIVEFAANKFEYNIVKAILETENNILVEGYALEYAAYNGYYEVLIDILEAGNNICLERIGHALQAGVKGNSVLIVKTILEKADISTEDKGKALLYAVNNGSYEIVEYILINDAQMDVDESYLLSIGSLGDNKISSQYKAEALNIAKENQDLDIINLLEKYKDQNFVSNIISTLGSWSARILGERSNYYPDISLRL